MYASTTCPHCKRNFSDKAAQRHIPMCPNIQHKAPSLVEKLKY